MNVTTNAAMQDRYRGSLKEACEILAKAKEGNSPKNVQATGGLIYQAISVIQSAYVHLPDAFIVEDSAAVAELIRLMGDDPARPGLTETPARFLKLLRERGAGYKADIKAIIKTFEDGAEEYDQMITQRNVPVWSLCEHHISPFFGSVSVAYIPDKKIVGLSKVFRLVDAFAQRLQVQERLTRQIGQALWEHLGPLGVGVRMECRHTCIESRGVHKSGSSTITCALFGVLKTDPSAKAEFLNFAR